MILSLRYGDLSGTVSEANRLANELGQYCDELSRKVQQKMYSVEGGMSNALKSADYYVNQKIRQLRTRESNARTLSGVVQNLLETAKRVDEDVEKTIQANQRSFFQKNPELKAPWYKAALTDFLCDMKKVPVLGWLIEAGEQAGSAIDTLLKDIRYWYKCEGGKELVGIILSWAEGICASVLLACACVFTGGGLLAVIVHVAGVISATIGYFNAGVNAVTSLQAYNAAKSNHPGIAQIYAGQDTLSDVLRQVNFHDRELNRKSNAWAVGLDITDTVCSVITIISGLKDAYESFKKINIKKVFQSICQPRDGSGRFIQGKATLWNGIKSIALKFNMKDFVLGDLNIKNLSRFTKLSSVDKVKTVGKLTKAVKGIVADFDKINERQQSVKDFLLKRIVTGLDTAFLKQEVLSTKVGDDGISVRKYRDTNFTSVMKAIRTTIDGIGLGKLLVDQSFGETWSDILGFKGGVIKNAKDIVKQIQVWTPPEVILENEVTKKAADVKNWNSARGYFDGLKQIDFHCDLSEHVFSMPTIKFEFNLKSIKPYYNIGAT